jgi:hypothetical protein
MKKPYYFFCIVAFLSISGPCYPQNVDPSYVVGRWSGFHSAAISYTFDDNCTNQLAVAVPMFDSYGYKLTLFVVSNWSPDWAGLNKAVSNGHEIGDHTVSHPSLDTMTLEQQKLEIVTALDIINSKIVGPKCVTFAYPFCNGIGDSLCGEYFIAARGCQGFIEASTPKDFMQVSSVACGNIERVRNVMDFKKRADSVAVSGGWLVYLIHGMDNDDGCCQLSSDTLRASLDYLQANKEKYWVSTFGNVARYIKERNCLTVSETSYQDTSISLQVTDTLDNNIYNFPLTIRRQLPQEWSSAAGTQNGLPLDVSIAEVNSIKYIMFDAVPGGGEVKLIKQ